MKVMQRLQTNKTSNSHEENAKATANIRPNPFILAVQKVSLTYRQKYTTNREIYNHGVEISMQRKKRKSSFYVNCGILFAFIMEIGDVLTGRL